MNLEQSIFTMTSLTQHFQYTVLPIFAQGQCDGRVFSSMLCFFLQMQISEEELKPAAGGANIQITEENKAEYIK